jgi:hypothetical protein
MNIIVESIVKICINLTVCVKHPVFLWKVLEDLTPTDYNGDNTLEVLSSADIH